MNKLFILSGASGAGKSTLLDRLVKDGYCSAAIKYSERKKFSTVDDITSVENIRDPRLKCDLIYSMYGNMYGFSSRNLKNGLKKMNQILITNEKNVIKKIKSFFPEQVIVIYIVSDINIDILKTIYMKRYGYPSIISKKDELVKVLQETKDVVLSDNTKEFIENINGINEIVNGIILKNEGFRLRAESIRHREQLYFNQLFTYDYVVLNFYSSSVSTVHATKDAYEQLKKIITKESEGDYE